MNVWIVRGGGRPELVYASETLARQQVPEREGFDWVRFGTQEDFFEEYADHRPDSENTEVYTLRRRRVIGVPEAGE